VAAELGARGVNCWSGYAYAWELAGALGLRDTGGGVRASVSHYNDDGDVDRLLAAVAELAG
jgi:Selenocysteine lyase